MPKVQTLYSEVLHSMDPSLNRFEQ